MREVAGVSFQQNVSLTRSATKSSSQVAGMGGTQMIEEGLAVVEARREAFNHEARKPIILESGRLDVLV